MVVTFQVPVGPGARGVHQVGTKLALSEHQVSAACSANVLIPKPRKALYEP